VGSEMCIRDSHKIMPKCKARCWDKKGQKLAFCHFLEEI